MARMKNVEVSPAEYELLLMARTDERTGVQIYEYARKLRRYEGVIDREAEPFVHPSRTPL